METPPTFGGVSTFGRFTFDVSDAEAKTRPFLAAHLGGTSPGEPSAK
jgi:hypothetical protein